MPSPALPPAVALCLLAAGLFLLWGMALGVVKYRAMMRSPQRMAPVYIDLAHRAALMYSFASLVMGELLRYSPYSTGVQLGAAAVPLALFAIATAKYVQLGVANTTDNQFRERNFSTTWGIWLLAAGEIGGVGVILCGFVQAQWFS